MKASIIPRTNSNVGYTQFTQRERFLKSEEYMKDQISVLLAGKVAQKVLFGKVSAQVENDRDSRRATDMATEMVKVYGMSGRLGQVNLSGDIPYSDGTKHIIDVERNFIINQAIQNTEKILTEHKKELKEIVEFLIKKEVIHAEDLANICGEKKFDEKLS